MFKIMTIPFDKEKETFLEEEINKFCINKILKNYKTEFFYLNNKAYWTVFIEYEEILKKEDKKFNKKDLNEKEQVLYDKLREWRKQKADALGYPVYILCTNNQLVSILKNKSMTIESLKQVNGFGKKKIEKYGRDIIEIVKNFYEIKK